MRTRRLPVAALLAFFAVARAILLRPATPDRPGLIQGAVLVIRRSAYEAVGGFAAQKASLLEHVPLGHAIQSAGYRVRTIPAGRLAATEMYQGFREAWEGIQKHIYPVFGCRVTPILTGALLCMVLIVGPPLSLMASAAMHVLAPSSDILLVVLLSVMATAFAAWFTTRVLVRELLPFLSWCLVPLSFFPFCVLAISSVLAYRQGRVRWKGRAYAPPWAPQDPLPAPPPLRRTP